AHGTLALNANGSFIYTANSGYTGADSFTYQASDGSLASGLASVSLTVTAAGNTPFVPQLLKDINLAAAGVTMGGPPVNVNGLAYFPGKTDEDGFQLWKSD